jgi:hypothetical protein
VVLKSRTFTPIGQSDQLVISGTGFSSPEAAHKSGERWIDVVILGFLRSNVRADFLTRRHFAHLNATEGVAWARELFGVGSEVEIINDRAGVMVLEDGVDARFYSGTATASVTTPSANVLAQIMDANRSVRPNPRSRLAFDIFSAAATMPSSDSQLLTYVMALEALIDPKPISDDAVVLLDQFAARVVDAPLEASERESLINRIRNLKTESIGQAGRRLARRLEGTEYLGRDPVAFFGYCYTLRGKLTHGGSRPPLEDVHMAAAHLQSFVRDVIDDVLTNGG